jgi:hypothetical protein
MFLGCVVTDGFPVTTPAKAGFSTHFTVAQATIGHPFLHDILDKDNLASEIIGSRNTL